LSYILYNEISTYKWIVDYSDLIIQNKLGEGAYGEVFLGIYRNQEVAIKRLNATLGETEMLQFQHEADILQVFISNFELIGRLYHPIAMSFNWLVFVKNQFVLLQVVTGILCNNIRIYERRVFGRLYKESQIVQEASCWYGKRHCCRHIPFGKYFEISLTIVA
jgi:serine/threonine protein kinase